MTHPNKELSRTIATINTCLLVEHKIYPKHSIIHMKHISRVSSQDSMRQVLSPYDR